MNYKFVLKIHLLESLREKKTYEISLEGIFKSKPSLKKKLNDGHY